ncbi:hypothetical protein [Legionella quateirensis]|uniref:Uncharacterized protein n=1 Tax=Legionella quateirensis TaxID=45072 RepID=A0A378L0Z7_9GAMM|nr:hypothetical protein [Legionella quateirensis]KTD44920.1 hypothetical protein Lqua_2755 [Legionella quateirensis]STY19457.1 Uncharacterised protein [Legionella quateirensis]
MVGNSFFDRAPAKHDKKQASSEDTFINVGGKQFQALAVAFIDYFKHSTRVNDYTLKKILERFYAHYPKFISNQAYLNPTDRMGILINSARKSEVVECLAYVLHQITIDEVYAHPLNYREAFDGLDVHTSKAFLRQPGTTVPSSVLRALSQALGITIVLFFTEHGKELRLRTIYSNGAPNMFKVELFLQVNEGNYFPRVKNEADYAYVGQLAIKPPEPVVNDERNKGTIAEMLDQIKTDNKQILRTYNQWRQNLLMEGLTREDLITLYIKFLPLQSSIIPDPKLFFSKLTAPEGKVVKVEEISNEQYVNEELAGTLAEWISINQVDPDLLLDYMDKPGMRTASPAA